MITYYQPNLEPHHITKQWEIIHTSFVPSNRKPREIGHQLFHLFPRSTPFFLCPAGPWGLGVHPAEPEELAAELSAAGAGCQARQAMAVGS